MASALLTRSSITRDPDDRLIAGVCGGLAAHWRLDPAVVRVGAMALTLCGGIGGALYICAWLLMPLAPSTGATPARRSDRADNLAALAIVAGTMLMLRAAGLWFGDRAAAVGGLAIVGVGLVWGRSTPAERRGDRSITLVALRIAVGVALVVGGSIAFASLWADTAELARAALAAMIVGAGVAALVGPYIERQRRELLAERRAHVRVEERAEIAAHLHDGVLQTLAVIQQRAGDERLVSNLARRQERELREWLFAPDTAEADSLAVEVRRTVAEVEDTYGVRIEAVCVGDRPLDEQVRALLGALREAAVNAARHSGAATIDVFVEVSGAGVEAFVRDRGVGFDRATVSPDRHGISESIIGRMHRIGGVASVRAEPGQGTEVALTIRAGSS